MPKVEVLSIEYRTPNPDARGIRRSALDLEQMNVLVKLGCGHHFSFENARLMTHWLSTADHQYESLRERFTVDCQQCGGCEVGLRLRSAAATRPPDVGVRLPDGRVFIPSGLPIKCGKQDS
jgi:hypothetical protein